MFIISPLMLLILKGTEKGRGPETSSSRLRKMQNLAKKCSAGTRASLGELCDHTDFSGTDWICKYLESRQKGPVLKTFKNLSACGGSNRKAKKSRQAHLSINANLFLNI